jgi:hypothetical protein
MNDPFGMPPDGRNRTVTRVPGTHSLRNGSVIATAVADWLATVLATARLSPRGGTDR